jgi:hypothetical protein
MTKGKRQRNEARQCCAGLMEAAIWLGFWGVRGTGRQLTLPWRGKLRFGSCFFSEADAQRFQESQIVPSERPVCVFLDGFNGRFGFCLDLVEADGGFKHEEDIKTLFADVFDDACNVLRLRDGLVDRFAKFLDKVFDLLIQCHLRAALWFEFTAHRVFPAKVTGGNGIAGTSVVPVLLKEYAHDCGGCNHFRLCIKRWDLGGFDDGAVVGPGRFEAVRQQFDGWRALAAPYQKASCRCAESTHHP